MEEKKEPKKLTDFLHPKDAELVKTYCKDVLREFGKYIKTIAVVGSLKTGIGKEPGSDLDVIVIVDDTDVERMTREEVKERLLLRLVEFAAIAEKKVLGEWKKKLHIQAYLLTEWWKTIMEVNPIIYTMLETGFPVVDRGFFLPLKILLKRGDLVPSRYAIDNLLKASNDLIRKTKKDFGETLAYQLYWAVNFAIHSLLMELGYKPPVPKRMPEIVREVLVKKFNLLKPQHVEIVEKAIRLWKDIEHGKRKIVMGRDIDELITGAEELLNKIQNIIQELRRQKGVELKWRVEKEEEEYKVERPGIIEEVLKEEKAEDITEKLEKFGVK